MAQTLSGLYSGDIDLVFSDVVMPGMTGRDRTPDDRPGRGAGDPNDLTSR